MKVLSIYQLIKYSFALYGKSSHLKYIKMII